MSDAPDDALRLRRAALIAAPVTAILLYAVCVGALFLILRGLFGGSSGDGIGTATLRWAIYLMPALAAPAAGALGNALLYGARGRRLAYWPNLGLIAGFTAIAMIWLLLAGGVWNTILAFVQLGGGILAWYLLRGAARGDAKRRA